MIEKVNSASSIAAMLKTLQTHAAQANGLGQDEAAGIATPKTDFSELIRQAVGQTNAAQLDSQKITQAFERGEAVPLTDVVLKMQKSSLSFEATLQVRNKVLKAYEDIMNMPV
jgi:flagellar hook-basal body complex protein FliE